MPLLPHQRDFLALSLRHNVLQVGGQWTLKSGRLSPYFYNAGGFNSGTALAHLGKFYAAALETAQLEYDILFGPAYKGIPLVAATAIAMANEYNKDVPYSFNRKEAKDHGEGGTIVGAKLKGKVVIIDDVITAGTAVRESVAILRAQGAELVGVVVAFDRQERGTGTISANAQVAQDLGVPVISIVTLENVIEYLTEVGGHESTIAAMNSYRAQYGAQ
ncbi:orotate phosphoribosyltransferase [Cladochytrium replicatum]|nr:orotate phosphoribosyltransferase [Cladochytrium replicatum]